MPAADELHKIQNMDIRQYNRDAWNYWVDNNDRWTVPVDGSTIVNARKGDWGVLLTNNQIVPREWFPKMQNLDVLCLASGGGQQGPIFAAAGANVTVFDNSPNQLAQDRLVADREKLDIKTIEGDMRDLSVFADESFELIFNPFSNNFIPDVMAVWHEAFRVLRPRGVLMSGFMNPAVYIFDLDLDEAEKKLVVRYPLPYEDPKSRPPDELKNWMAQQQPLEFSHSISDQLGGQLRVGLQLTDLYEDRHDPEQFSLAKYMPTLLATRGDQAPSQGVMSL